MPSAALWLRDRPLMPAPRHGPAACVSLPPAPATRPPIALRALLLQVAGACPRLRNAGVGQAGASTWTQLTASRCHSGTSPSPPSRASSWRGGRRATAFQTRPGAMTSETSRCRCALPLKGRWLPTRRLRGGRLKRSALKCTAGCMPAIRCLRSSTPSFLAQHRHPDCLERARSRRRNAASSHTTL
jgi:hypothetical protein